jgi:uncharacterized protein YprB with RNaseH-like and TPR domain
MEFSKLIDKFNPVITVSDQASRSAITLYTGADAMLEVKEDGFYVRGVRVPADENEARAVYESFKSWLAWAHLSKNS